MANTVFPNFGNYQPMSEDIELIVTSLREQDEKRTCTDNVFQSGITNGVGSFVTKDSGNTISVLPLIAYNASGKRVEIESTQSTLAPNPSTKKLESGGTWQSSTTYIIVVRYVSVGSDLLVNPIDAMDSAYSRYTDSYELYALRRTGSVIDSFDSGDVKLAKVIVDSSGNITVYSNETYTDGTSSTYQTTQYLHIVGTRIIDGITNTYVPSVYGDTSPVTFRDHINCIGTGTISSTNPHGGNLTNFDGTISNTQISDGAVSTSKIVDLSITTAKLADGAISSSKLNANLMKVWEKNTYYAIGNIVYPTDSDFNKLLPNYSCMRLECVKAGVSSLSIEPDWYNEFGTLKNDSGVIWINDDIRDGHKVGDIRMVLCSVANWMTLYPNYVLADGCGGILGTETLLSRANYPRLWQYANDCGLITDETTWLTSKYYGYFSTGDGSTTFRVPYLLESFLRPGISNLGIYSDDELKIHNHTLQSGPGGGGGPGAVGLSSRTADATTDQTGSTETKPKSIYVLPLIKF